jgi:hypothetical protein
MRNIFDQEPFNAVLPNVAKETGVSPEIVARLTSHVGRSVYGLRVDLLREELISGGVRRANEARDKINLPEDAVKDVVTRIVDGLSVFPQWPLYLEVHKNETLLDGTVTISPKFSIDGFDVWVRRREKSGQKLRYGVPGEMLPRRARVRF